jgi:hypothetical protein
MSPAVLPIVPDPPSCLFGTAGGCTWASTYYKHTWKRGVRREHTMHGPALYFEAVPRRQVEEATIRAPGAHRGAVPGKSEYLREVGEVIGWDEGCDASLSYVECSGGPGAGRAFHGRPMHAENATVRAIATSR